MEIGRDGCRVPLPWAAEGASFGFGDGGAHLPQPAWFGRYAVAAQDGAEGSTLEFYRQALKLRRELQTSEELEWLETGNADVLHFRRPGGWQSVTNFGMRPGGPARRRGAGQQRPARRTASCRPTPPPG